jgi:hypothetical protein
MLRFWSWYDRLNEPWRLLLCIAFFLPVCFITYFVEHGMVRAVKATIMITAFLALTKWYSNTRPRRG